MADQSVRPSTQDGEAVLDVSSFKDGESMAIALLKQLNESTTRANAECSKRHLLLGKLEELFTSMTKEWRSIKEQHETTIVNGEAGVNVKSVEPLSPGTVRTNCIDAMMGKTVFKGSSYTTPANSETEKAFVPRFRRMYEMIYDSCSLSSPILRYLQSRPKVEIVVDCGKKSIFDMLNVPLQCRSNYLHNGRMFVDMKQEKLYFGGFNENKSYSHMNMGGNRCFGNQAYAQSKPTIDYSMEREDSSFLVMGLLQLAMNLMFENGGRPFALLDTLAELQFSKVLQAVEKEMKENDKIHDFVRTALESKLPSQRDSALMAAVPGAVVEWGSSEKLWYCEMVPLSLSLFYKCQVLRKLNIEVANS